MATRKRNVLVLSDHPLFRQALGTLLRDDGYQVTEQACTTALRVKRPDVALVDLTLALTDTTKLLAGLTPHLADSHVVLLGSPTRLAGSRIGGVDAEIELERADLGSLRSVIAGKATSPSAQLTRAHRLWSQVTARQRDVMRWLAFGLDNPGIAAKLRVGTRAVKAHISALLALFGLDSRTQLALTACEGGLRPPDVR